MPVNSRRPDLILCCWDWVPGSPQDFSMKGSGRGPCLRSDLGMWMCKPRSFTCIGEKSACFVYTVFGTSTHSDTIPCEVGVQTHDRLAHAGTPSAHSFIHLSIHSVVHALAHSTLLAPHSTPRQSTPTPRPHQQGHAKHNRGRAKILVKAGYYCTVCFRATLIRFTGGC